MRVLLFGTNYCDTREKSRVLEMWCDLATRTPGSRSHMLDVLVVDSQSPMLPYIPLPIRYYTFKDNIGHLSRNGRDGWGRAFSYGLFRAIAEDFDYAVHVECDSLLKASIWPTLDWMQTLSIPVASTPMSSTPKSHRSQKWIETGLIFFRVEWLKQTSFIQNYCWEKQTNRPVPEAVISRLATSAYRDIPQLKTMRDDFKELTKENLSAYQLDWLTHAPLEIMEQFYAEA